MKRILSFILAVVLTFGIMIIPANVTASAKTPDPITWEYDSGTKKLTVRGNGKMEALITESLNYESASYPWHEKTGEIESVYIEEGVTSISVCAFSLMGNLKNVSIPSTVEYIGDMAFSGCNSLEEINIPDGVVSLGYQSFINCTSLRNITIGKSLSEFDSDIFLNCISVENYSVSPENTALSSEDGVLFNKNKTRLIKYPVANKKETYNVPEGVETIGSAAFYEAESLQNISLPDSVTHIEENAFDFTGYFDNEDNWTDGVLYLNDKYLISAKGVSGNYKVKEGTKVIAGGACLSLTGITIPASVISVGEGALCTVQNITVDEENEYLTSVDNVLFTKDMSELVCYPAAKTETSYEIPSGVTKIARYAFYAMEASALTYIKIPEGITEIGDFAFYGNGRLAEISFPDSLVSIGKSAFFYCASLESLEFGSGLKSIGDMSFTNCKSLTSLNFSKGIEKIGYMSFAICAGIEKLVIPSSIKSIGMNAFVHCQSLNEVVIGTEYGLTDYNSIFVEPSKTVVGSNAFAYCNIKKAVLNVESIDSFAFNFNNELESVVLFDGLKEIGTSVFKNCETLKDIYYYGTAEEWDNTVIFNCNDNLLNVNFNFMRKGNETYGIIATYPVDCFGDEEVTLSVEEVQDSKNPQVGDFCKVEGRNRIALYNIKAINADFETVQPVNGKVVLRIPIPEEYIGYTDFVIGHFYSGNHEVFSTNPANKNQKTMRNIDGYLVFEIEHFSEFVVATFDSEKENLVLPSVSIKNKDTVKTIKYGETLRLTANAQNMTEGAKIFWYAGDEKVGEGETLEITPKENINITVKIVDANGIPCEGENTSDSQTITVKTNLFWRIIAFFRNLLGLNKIISQAIGINLF